MQLSRDDFDVGESGAAKAVGNPLGGALDVRLVLALRADAGNAQEFVEIGEMLIVLLFDVGVQLHCGSLMGSAVSDDLAATALECTAEWHRWDAKRQSHFRFSNFLQTVGIPPNRAHAHENKGSMIFDLAQKREARVRYCHFENSLVDARTFLTKGQGARKQKTLDQRAASLLDLHSFKRRAPRLRATFATFRLHG